MSIIWRHSRTKKLTNLKVAILKRFGGSIPFIVSEISRPSRTYCFSGSGLVAMASGATKRVSDIVPGDVVRTQCGSQAVRHVFKEDIRGQRRHLVSVCGFYLTRRHPVFFRDAWRMPTEVGPTVDTHDVEAIYNFELADGPANPDHTVWINGLLVCTLGKDLGAAVSKEQDEVYGSGYWRRTKA